MAMRRGRHRAMVPDGHRWRVMISGMPTLVCFHAHPDDESIATGGLMARAAADGHRVVLVLATRGEVGEVADGFLEPGETLGDRRSTESADAAAVLGAERVEFLGYHDSGMKATPTTERPDCFWQADVEEAAQRLAAILTEVDADVLTIYDDNGGYGHPDHIQVHRVGLRAAAIAGVTEVYEATINRAHFERLMRAAAESNGGQMPEGMLEIDEFDDDFGVPEERITHAVDVREHAPRKRQAMAAHASQIDETSFFMQMPVEVFAESFGWEFYIRYGYPRPLGEPIAVVHDLFTGDSPKA